jgi:hypothetical protein
LRARTALLIEVSGMGGTNVVWTGVYPPPIAAAPPQKPFSRGLPELVLGRSFCVLGAMIGDWALCAGEGDAVRAGLSGAGGGRATSSIPSDEPRPVSKLRLSAATSCRRATFSDLEEPSSERMAEMRASRSDMSASRVDMYSVWGIRLVGYFF